MVRSAVGEGGRPKITHELFLTGYRQTGMEMWCPRMKHHRALPAPLSSAVAAVQAARTALLYKTALRKKKALHQPPTRARQPCGVFVLHTHARTPGLATS